MDGDTDRLRPTSDDGWSDMASEGSGMSVDPKYDSFQRIYSGTNVRFRDEAVHGIEALVLSFLTQLDSALKPEKVKKGGNVLAQRKPKVELQIANRTKETRDGY